MRPAISPAAFRRFSLFTLTRSTKTPVAQWLLGLGLLTAAGFEIAARPKQSTTLTTPVTIFDHTAAAEEARNTSNPEVYQTNSATLVSQYPALEAYCTTHPDYFQLILNQLAWAQENTRFTPQAAMLMGTYLPAFLMNIKNSRTGVNVAMQEVCLGMKLTTQLAGKCTGKSLNLMNLKAKQITLLQENGFDLDSADIDDKGVVNISDVRGASHTPK